MACSGKFIKRIASLVLAVTICLADPFSAGQTLSVERTARADTTLTVNQAIALAIANSSTIEDLEYQMDTKQAQYSSALKSITANQKRRRSVKWSFLLSIKFPEDASEYTEYEEYYKPLSILSEYNVLDHKATDQEVAEAETIYGYFVDIYTLQSKIDFNKERLTSLNAGLWKNKARVLLGLAEQSDVDSIQKNIDTITSTVSKDQTSLANTKEKLSKAIGLDVSTGYTFENPYREGEIPRTELEDLIQYTLDNSQDYYTSCEEESQAKISLEQHYKLYRENFRSSDMALISTYVDTLLNGGSISKTAFKKAYKSFLTAIDSYWQGKKRIFWFIKIPKIWFKDTETDGTNYLVDDPEALYSVAIEYIEKVAARENMEEEIETNVTDSFNNYISFKNAYESAVALVDSTKEDYEKAYIQNSIGLMAYDEFSSYKTAYEDAEISMLDALSDYSEGLYSFNRLTCGRIIEYLNAVDAGTGAASEGISFVTDEVDDDCAYYYIEPIVQTMEFMFHVYIPEDFKIQPDYFELWVGNTRIGDKTAIDKPLRHLQVDITGDDAVKVKLFDGDTVLGECQIDPYNYYGTLTIEDSDEATAAEEDVIGTYSMTTNDVTGLVSLYLTPDDDLDVNCYLIKDDKDQYLISSDKVDIEEAFRYLSVISSSIDKLRVELYNDDELVATAGFDPENLNLVKVTDSE